MRILAIIAAVVIGWSIALAAITGVQIAFGVDRSNPDVVLAAIIGGVVLALLVARLLPRGWRWR
jgi:hypothetical protein